MNQNLIINGHKKDTNIRQDLLAFLPKIFCVKIGQKSSPVK